MREGAYVLLSCECLREGLKRRRPMRIIRHTDPDFQKQLATLQRRAEPDAEVRRTVADIIEAVRARGDAALLEFTGRFGGPKPAPGGTSRSSP